MARGRSLLRNAVEYAAAVAVVKTLEWPPRAISMALARFYVGALDLALPRLRRTARRNLSLALPESKPAERENLVDGVFLSIARLLVAFAKLPRMRDLSEWIRYEGREHFDRALERGRGVLFATGHLGNWELSAFAHGRLAGPMHVVVRPLDNPWIDRLVSRRRALSGNRVIEKKDFARGILSALRHNEAVGILIDQNAGLQDGVFVDFFGIPACSGAGFARMAAHSGAAVIPGFAVWNRQERRYVLKFYPPVEMTGDAREDTARLQKQMEAAIREHPDQWLWIHRRWKTRPPGEPSLYESARSTQNALC